MRGNVQLSLIKLKKVIRLWVIMERQTQQKKAYIEIVG